MSWVLWKAEGPGKHPSPVSRIWCWLAWWRWWLAQCYLFVVDGDGSRGCKYFKVLFPCQACIEGYLQETAFQPVELAGCLILARPSPLRWAVRRVCWLSWLCWAVAPSSQSNCTPSQWCSGCGGQLWWCVLQRTILQSLLHAGCLTHVLALWLWCHLCKRGRE